MKVDFPRYDNYEKHYSNEVYTREIDENSYFKTIDDFKTFFDRHLLLDIKHCKEYETDILNAIENKKVCKFLAEELKFYKTGKHILIKMYPFGEVREYWSKQYDQLVEVYKQIILKNNAFIKENRVQVFDILNETKNKKIIQMKEKRKIANQKYYKNTKEILNTDEIQKPLLTEDEKLERKKLANKKYYEKRISEKPLKPEKHILTEEEKRERRKEANKRYYDKKNKEETV